MQHPNFTLISDAIHPANNSGGTEGDKPAARKSKPRHPLPSDRIKIANQLELLKAYAIGSNFGTTPTTYIKAAGLANLGANSASLCNGFFYEMGLLERIDGGVMPTQPVIEYARACEWGREDASHKLAPAIQGAWFAQTLAMHLKMRPMSLTDAITKLAEEAAVGKDFQAALRLCVEYLEIAGTIRRNGDMLQLCGSAETVPIKTDSPAAAEEREAPAETAPKERSFRTTNGPIFPQTNGGAVRLAFDVTVTMAEMGTWAPERISRFFAGLAQVLAAKHGADLDSE